MSFDSNQANTETTDASILLNSISPFKHRDDLMSAGLLGMAIAGGKYPFVMRSCGIFQSNSKLRSMLIKIFISPKFEQYVWFVLLLNTLVAGYYLEPSSFSPNSVRQLTLEYLQIAILVLFTLEALGKMISFGIYQHKYAYFKSVWDRVDFYIVVISWLVWIFGGARFLGYTTIFRCFRILKPQIPPRESKPAALDQNNTDRKSVSRALINSIVLLSQFAIVLVIFYFLFGIIGVQLYNGTLRNRCYDIATNEIVDIERPCSTNPDSVGAWFCESGQECKLGPSNPGRGWASFDNIFLSMLTIFQVSSQVGWTDVMYLVQDANGSDNWIFFVLIIIVFTFFLLNLTAAVLIEGFDSSLPDEDDILLKKQVREQEILLHKRMHETAVFADKRKQYQLQMIQKNINPASTAARDLAESVFGEIPLMANNAKNFPSSEQLFEQPTEPQSHPEDDLNFDIPLVTTDISVPTDPESSSLPIDSTEVGDTGPDTGVGTGTGTTTDVNLDTENQNQNQNQSADVSTPWTQKFVDKVNQTFMTFHQWCIQTYLKNSFEYIADLVVLSNCCVASAAYYYPDLPMPTPYWTSLYSIYLVTVFFVEVPEIIIKIVGYSDAILTDLSLKHKILMAIRPATYSPIIYDSRFDLYPEKVKIARFGITFDMAVILISIIEASLYLAGIWPYPTMFCVFRGLRFAILILRHMYKNDDISDNIDMFIGSSFAIFRLFIILAAFVFIFAILGMGIFGNADGKPGMVLPDGLPPRANFNSFWNALVSTFQLVSTENLFLILWDAMVVEPVWGAAYVVFVVAFSNYILLNLFVGIIVSVFSTRSRTLRSREAVQHVREWEGMQQRMQSRVFLLELAILSQKIHTETDETKPNAVGGTRSGNDTTSNDDTQSTDDNDDASASTPTSSGSLKFAKIKKWFKEFRPERSFYIFKDSNFLRSFATYYVDTVGLQVFIIIASLVTFFIVAGDFSQGIGSSNSVKPADDVTYYIALAYTSFYGLEIILRGIAKHLVRGPNAYLSSLENRIDFLVFCCLAINMASTRVLFLFFLLPFRLFSRSTPGVIVIVSSLVKASRDLFHLFVLGVVVYWIFAINGLALFGGRFSRCECIPADGSDSFVLDTLDMTECLAISNETTPCLWKPFFFYFDNIFHSLVSLFVASNLAGVMDLLWAGVDSVGIGLAPVRDHHPVASIYFIIFIIVSSFIIINLFVGVVVDTFTTIYEELAGVAYLTGRQREWIEAKRWLSLEKPIALPPVPSHGRFLPWRQFCHTLVTFPYHDFHHQVLAGRMPHMQHRFSLSRYIESWFSGTWGKDCYSTVNMSDVRTYFDNVIFALIIINTGMVAVEHHGQPPWVRDMLFWGNMAFLIVFCFEALFRISATGWGNYWSNPWNKFDFIIIVVSIFSIIILSFSFISTERFVSPQILRIGRLIRILRLLKTKKIRRVLTTLYSAIPNTVDILLVLILLLFGFSLACVAMFGNIPQDGWITPRANFETFGMSMLTLVRILTVDSWSYIMYDCMFRPESPGYVSFIFFVFYVVLMSYVVVSLFIAILLDKFSLTSAYETGTVNSEAVARFRTVWLAYDPYATGSVPTYALRSMLTQIPRSLGLLGTTRPGYDLLHLTKKLRIRCTNSRVEFRSLLLALAANALGQPRVEAELSGVFGSSAVFRIQDKYGALSPQRWKFLPTWLRRRLAREHHDPNKDTAQDIAAISIGSGGGSGSTIVSESALSPEPVSKAGTSTASDIELNVTPSSTSLAPDPTQVNNDDTAVTLTPLETDVSDPTTEKLDHLSNKLKEQELCRKYVISSQDLGLEVPQSTSQLIFSGSFFTKDESVTFSQPTLHKEIAASIIQANYRGYLARKKLHSEMTETYHQVLLSPVSLLKKLSQMILNADRLNRNKAVVDQYEQHEINVHGASTSVNDSDSDAVEMQSREEATSSQNLTLTSS